MRGILQRLARHMHGGYLAAVVFVAVFLLDLHYADDFPALKANPKEHIADIIGASGVAVAFVLTYLAALTGLPSPGRYLLSSALLLVQHQGPYLSPMDPEGRIPHADFLKLERFLDSALDLAKHNAAVVDAYHLFMHVVALAKPNHRGPDTSIHHLEKIGYSHLRAYFLHAVVFRPNAERRHLLRATVLCASVFVYAIAMYLLHLHDHSRESVALMLAYPILGFVGGSFAVALALRMWPHHVARDGIDAILKLLEGAMRLKVVRSTNVLDEVIADATAKKAVLDKLNEQVAEGVTQQMVEDGLRVLEETPVHAPEVFICAIYTAMRRAADD